MFLFSHFSFYSHFKLIYLCNIKSIEGSYNQSDPNYDHLTVTNSNDKLKEQAIRCQELLFLRSCVMDCHATTRGSISGGDGLKTDLHVLRKGR